MATRIGIYNLRIMGPDLDADEDPSDWDKRNQEVIDGLNFSRALLALNKNMPEGYYAKIEDH